MIVECVVGKFEVLAHPSRLLRRHRIEDELGHHAAPVLGTSEFQELAGAARAALLPAACGLYIQLGLVPGDADYLP
jgi:hypothetical protein